MTPAPCGADPSMRRLIDQAATTTLPRWTVPTEAEEPERAES
ncbi:hypothetical protein WN990_38755 [Kitasatospora purpeofusca]